MGREFSLSKFKDFQSMLNHYFMVDPKQVDFTTTTNYYFYRKQLYMLFLSRFIFKNAPVHWDIDYLKDTLFRYGYMGIVSHEGITYCLRCGVTGDNVYDKPTTILIDNHVLPHLEKKIGLNGQLLYFQYLFGNFQNINDFINTYAVKLSSCDCTLNTTIINSRIAMVFTGKNKAQLESAREIYSKVSHGEPAIFKYGSDMSDDNISPVLFNNVKNNFIGNEILQTKKEIMDDFLTMIGVKNANTNKRERLNSDEVNANEEETYSMIGAWIETINRCFDDARQCPELNVGDITCVLRKGLTENEVNTINSIVTNV